jgi:hypothetical protein
LRAIGRQLDNYGAIRPVRRQEQLSVEKVFGGSHQAKRLGSRRLQSKAACSIGAHAFEGMVPPARERTTPANTGIGAAFSRAGIFE